MMRIKRTQIALLITLLVFVVFFARLFFPEPKVFYTPDYARSDIWNFHYPVKDFLSRSLKEGELPFWTKDIGTGIPLFAEGQIGSLYFPNLILFYLFPTWLAWNLSYILVFIITVSGAYLFFKKLGVSKASSLFSSLAFSFSGFFVTKMVHISYLQSASLIPLIFLTGSNVWERASKKNVFIFAFLLAQQIFTGGTQWVFIGLFGMVIYKMLHRQEKSADELLKKVAVLALSTLFGLCLAGPQLFPSIELKNLSMREKGLLPSEIYQFPFGIKNLINFVLPDYLGTPKDGSYQNPFENGSGIYWENTVYLGILTLLFFVIALLIKKKKRSQKSLLFLAAFSLILALGETTPISFILTLPVFNNFRVPSRYLVLTIFSISALSGFGLDTFMKWLEKRKKFASTVNSIFILIFLVLVFDLFNFGFNYHPLVTFERALEAPDSAVGLNEDERIYTLPEQGNYWNDQMYSQGWKDADPYLYFKNSLDANLNLLYGISNVRAYTPFASVREMFQNVLAPTLINSLAVKKVISPVKLDEKDVLELEKIVEPSRSDLPYYYIYKNNQALEKSRLVSKYFVGHSIQDIVSIINGEDFSFRDSVILEWDPQISFEELDIAEVEIVKDTNREFIAKTNSDKEAILIVANSIYPSWKAMVNKSNEAEIFPANINSMAIILPPGDNLVEFTFEATSFKKGVVVCVSSLAIYLILIFFNPLRLAEKLRASNNIVTLKRAKKIIGR